MENPLTTAIATSRASAQAKSPGLWAQIREDWNVNGRDWTRPGFRALAVHRFGVWRMRVKSRLLRMPLSFIYRMLFRFVRNHYGIELYYTVKVGRRVLIGHQGAIVIHPHTEIGDDCVLRQSVTLGASSHWRAYEAPKIGNGVHMGVGSMALGNIVVGDGASIGANVVVTRDVPAHAKIRPAPYQVILPQERPKLDSDGPKPNRFSGLHLSVVLILLDQWLRGVEELATHLSAAASCC